MQANTALGLTHIATGVLVILLCLPLLKDKIGPNRFYGVRIKKAFESREHWFKLQRFGAWQLIVWGGVLAVCGIVALIVPFNRDQGVLYPLFSLAPICLIIIPLIQTFRYAKTL